MSSEKGDGAAKTIESSNGGGGGNVVVDSSRGGGGVGNTNAADNDDENENEMFRKKLLKLRQGGGAKKRRRLFWVDWLRVQSVINVVFGHAWWATVDQTDYYDTKVRWTMYDDIGIVLNF